MVRAPAAMFVKPKMPATMDTRKKISAHFNIVHLPSVAASGAARPSGKNGFGEIEFR
jgi:hypothetical protein